MANELKCITPFGTDKEILELTIDWTSSTGGASTTSTDDISFLTQTVTDVIKGRYLMKAQTVPSATVAPTADYDIVVNDANGEDYFEGALADRSATATESVFPSCNSVNAVVPIPSALSIAVTNAGNAKAGKAIFYIE